MTRGEGPDPARRSTIRDVAALAGVSTATVSRALRGGEGVEPATRAKVETAALELRYRPSGVARSLKLRSTQTIGLIVTDIENPFFPQLVRAVEDGAHERGFAVILADGRRDPDREIQSLEVLARRQVDGLIIASSAITERHASWFEDARAPVVVINGRSPLASVPSVLSDHHAGGRLAGAHLLELGHRHIVYVGARETFNNASEDRLAGMSEALTGADVQVETVLGDGSVDAGEQAAVEALERWPRTTAFACYNDLTAVGALRGLRSREVRVPAEMSVVGFDDIPLARFTEPPLTTVRQATDAIGRYAANLLIDMIDQVSAGGDEADVIDESVRRMPVELVVRGSTAAPPG